jgi:hypothetical protein
MHARRLLVYVDASVIGGCEDEEFRTDSLALWQRFVEGHYMLALSAHTMRELEGAPEAVSAHIDEVPEFHQLLLPDSEEASELAVEYLRQGVLGPGSHADALHIALATVGQLDVLVSWNFRHIVNLGRIRLFNGVNLQQGYGSLEIRTPKEVLQYEEDV